MVGRQNLENGKKVLDVGRMESGVIAGWPHIWDTLYSLNKTWLVNPDSLVATLLFDCVPVSCAGQCCVVV